MKKKKGRQKAWSGRFALKTDKLFEEMNSSLGFDKRLFRHDVRGSIAHALVLEKAGVLTKGECKRIAVALRAIEREIASGKVRFSSADEDIHMAIEGRLIKKVGALGGKLHTGRSRNDQVATDVRLYLKDEIFAVAGLLHEMKKALVDVAEANLGCVMPGYTHLQRAQPVLFSHHLLAYYEMFKRDSARLFDCLERTDELPLGSGALAGSPYKLDRAYAARLLGFSRISENSMDAVSARDFIVEFLSGASIIMMHLSRLSEELILWSTSEFGFVELSDAFTTGSSIMPQKKNPDAAELTRAKAGRVYGDLIAMLTVMKALPLAYNKDMQEDKEPLFDAVDTLKGVLGVYPPMLRTMRVDPARMRAAVKEGFLNATDAADYLVKKGVAFREAHGVVGRVVAWCVKKSVTLEDLSLAEWRRFSKKFDSDIKRAIGIERSLNSRRVRGSSASKNVAARLKVVKAELKRGGC
jgi:argininosuccinate lyase